MPFHRPYDEDAANAIYNLMFADAPEQFAQGDDWLPAVFAASFDEAAVRTIADDESAESRARLLAFSRLRAERAEVPSKLLLGVVAEVRLDDGMDTLAAYADGRVRYINQAGGMVFIEDDLAVVGAEVRALFEAARSLLEHIGPWEDERMPAPMKARQVRLSCLASDGLYFGQGDMADLVRDPIAGPVFRAAATLLAAVVDFAADGRDGSSAGS